MLYWVKYSIFGIFDYLLLQFGDMELPAVGLEKDESAVEMVTRNGVPEVQIVEKGNTGNGDMEEYL